MENTEPRSYAEASTITGSGSFGLLLRRFRRFHESRLGLLLGIPDCEPALSPVTLHLIAGQLPVGGPLGQEGLVSQQSADPAAQHDTQEDADDAAKGHPRRQRSIGVTCIERLDEVNLRIPTLWLLADGAILG
jgi:hypothetical protein